MSQVSGPCEVAFGGFKCFSLKLLQVGRLSIEEQFVDGGDVKIFHESEPHAQTKARQEMHGFFRADRASAAEDSEGPSHLIVQFSLAFGEHQITDSTFPADDLSYDGADLADEFCFALSKRYLVGDLIEVAHGLAAFTVQAADSMVDLLGRMVDFLDFARHAERGKMQHHAHANPGTYIGGAGGEVTEFFMEGVGSTGLDLVIDGIAFLPAFFERKSAVKRLQPEMIFFVDHDAVTFTLTDYHRASSVGFGEFATDDLTFDEQLAVERAKSFHIEKLHGLILRVCFEKTADELHDLMTRVGSETLDEWEPGEIASQANPA